MIEWNETHRTVQTMVRDFVEKEIAPNVDDLEYNGVPPYDILRKFVKTFGLDEMAKARFEKQIAREEAKARGASIIGIFHDEAARARVCDREIDMTLFTPGVAA